jgi:hypothetical protein
MVAVNQAKDGYVVKSDYACFALSWADQAIRSSVVPIEPTRQLVINAQCGLDITCSAST